MLRVPVALPYRRIWPAVSPTQSMPTLHPLTCLARSYCDSRASEPATRALVIETLAHAAWIPGVAAELVRHHGAGAWVVAHVCAKGGGALDYPVPRTRLQYALPLYARPPASQAPLLDVLRVRGAGRLRSEVHLG
jgi:hypothetical protein